MGVPQEAAFPRPLELLDRATIRLQPALPDSSLGEELRSILTFRKGNRH
jgi:hypothetical protein